MFIVTLGIDSAKKIFQLNRANADGEVVLTQQAGYKHANNYKPDIIVSP